MHTKYTLVIPTLVGLLLTSVLACNDAEQDPMLVWAQVELDIHRTLWKQSYSSNYTYEYNVLCECSDNFGEPVRVTVTNGDIESIVYAESGPYRRAGDPPSSFKLVGRGPRYYTIDGLFDVIQNAITNEVDQLTASYDSEFGYPTNFEIDYRSDSIDDEYIVTANAYSPR